VFLGDDGFGVAVAHRLARRELPAGVDVRDFGIRGLDLAYALQDGYDVAVLVDAAPGGEAPGTVSAMELEGEDDEVVPDAQGMNPRRVLALAQALGAVPPRVLLVACEPETIVHGEHDGDLVGELSAPVQAALDGAVELVCSLIETEIEATRKAVRR